MAEGFVHTVHQDGVRANTIEGEKQSLPGTHERKEAAVAAGRAEAIERKTEHVIHNEDGTIGSDDLPLLLQLATQRVTYQAIHANIGSLLMFHAAAVCHPETGAALVAIAPGGTGKTTVCRTLGRGRGYLSDETVGVRADNTIVPYPKPLSVRRTDWDAKDETDPRSIGLAATAVTPYVAAMRTTASSTRSRSSAITALRCARRSRATSAVPGMTLRLAPPARTRVILAE